MSGKADRTKRTALTDAAVLIGAGTLAVTLIFNMISVRQATHETSRARVASEIALLTQVGEVSNRAAQQLIAIGANDKRCERAVGLSLTDAEEARLAAALTYYDYLAWLFNNRQVTLEDARAYWGPDMIDVYSLGRKFQGEQVDALYEELSSFSRAAPSSLRPDDPCS